MLRGALLLIIASQAAVCASGSVGVHVGIGGEVLTEPVPSLNANVPPINVTLSALSAYLQAKSKLHSYGYIYVRGAPRPLEFLRYVKEGQSGTHTPSGSGGHLAPLSPCSLTPLTARPSLQCHLWRPDPLRIPRCCRRLGHVRLRLHR